MGKPTKKNIRRKNRRTRRKVNKKKTKKGGVSFGFNKSIGLCNADEKGILITYNKYPITGKFLNETGQEIATLKKICQDKTNPDTITFLINDGQNKRMTPDAFKNTYIYYQPSAEGGEKFEYKIEGDTLSKKIFPKNPIRSMFSFLSRNKK